MNKTPKPQKNSRLGEVRYLFNGLLWGLSFWRLLRVSGRKLVTIVSKLVDFTYLRDVSNLLIWGVIIQLLSIMDIPVVIGKMVVPLGWGPLNNQPHIHLISRGYLLGPNPLLKGSLGCHLFGVLSSRSSRAVRSDRPKKIDLWISTPAGAKECPVGRKWSDQWFISPSYKWGSLGVK